MATDPTALSWPPLIPGSLMRRYKRFLADIRLESGETVTAHCPNPGSMKSCCEPGRPVWVWRNANPRRKLRYSWELIAMPASLVGVNSLLPNRLVPRAIAARAIPELGGYERIQPEVRAGEGARLDLLLTEPGGGRCYVEIKNCTLVRDGVAAFPDAVTRRGQKHLAVLKALAEAGARCLMFYLIQRMDARRFTPADAIDPAYGRALRDAVQAGVEVLAYDVRLDLRGIGLGKKRPVVL